MYIEQNKNKKLEKISQCSLEKCSVLISPLLFILFNEAEMSSVRVDSQKSKDFPLLDSYRLNFIISTSAEIFEWIIK